VARPVDPSKLRANAGSRLGRGKASANARSIEHIVGVALKRGAGAKRNPVDLETKIASVRAMLGASRTAR